MHDTACYDRLRQYQQPYKIPLHDITKHAVTQFYYGLMSESFRNVVECFGKFPEHSVIYVITSCDFRLEIALGILENAGTRNLIIKLNLSYISTCVFKSLVRC